MRLKFVLPTILALVFALCGLASSAQASSSYTIGACTPAATQTFSGDGGGGCSGGALSTNLTGLGGCCYGTNQIGAPANELYNSFSFNSSTFNDQSGTGLLALAIFGLNGGGDWYEEPNVGCGANSSNTYWLVGGGTTYPVGPGCAWNTGALTVNSSTNLYDYSSGGSSSGTFSSFGILRNCWGGYDSCGTGNQSMSETITNITATLVDPNTTPTLATSASAGTPWADGSTTKWYSGAGFDSYGATASSTDDGGTCYLSPTLTPTSSATNGGNTVAPSVYSTGAFNDTSDYDASIADANGTGTGQFVTQTCSNPSAASSIAINNLAAVPSGSYYLNVQAQNPAQYSGGAVGTTSAEGATANSSFISGSSPTSGEQLNLDNVSPTAAWNSTSTAYSPHTTEELTATVGSSGIGSVTCTDNGSSVTPVALGSNPSSGAGTYNYNVPTAAQGANTMSCVVANGDTGTALTATTTPQTFNVDTTSPTVTVPATNSSWISSPASLAVGTTAGPSGIANISCSNSNNSDVYNIAASTATIPASDNSNGVNTWTCQATSGAGLASALATVTEKLDSSSPSGSLSGDSAGTWYSTAIPLNFTTTVGVSGLRSVACTDSIGSGSYAEFTSTSGTIPAADNINGVNNWTCVVTDNAGSTTNVLATEQLDTTIPTVSVPTSSANWTATPAALAVGGSDSVSGIASITCSDSANSNTYSVATSSGSIPATDQSSGTNSWTCYSTNNAGTNSATGVVTEKLDAANPTIVWANTSNSYSTATSEQLNVAVGPSGISSVTCTDNGASVVLTSLSTNPSGGAGTYSYTVPTTFQGANSMACSVSNGDVTPVLTSNASPQTFNVDTTSPTVSVASTSGFQSSAKALALTATVGASGIANVSCSDSNNSNTYTTTSASGSIPASDMTDGTNTWTCQVTNNAGVASTMATGTEELDDTVPTISVPATNASWISTPVSLAVSATGGSSSIASITCSDSNNSNVYVVNASSGAIPTSDETNGANTWTCYSTNNAGVSSSNASVTEKLDTTSPTVTLPSQPENVTWQSTATAIAVSGSDNVSGIDHITCSDSLNGATYTIEGASGAIPASSQSNGANTWSCEAYNAAGTSGDPTYTEYLDNQTPTVTFDTTASQTSTYTLISDVPPIKVDGTVGPSGLSSFTCAGDGISATYASLSNDTINLSNLKAGAGRITCTVASNSGLTSSSSFDLTVGATNADNVPGNANIQGSVLAISGPTAVSFSGELTGQDQSLNDPTPADQSLVATDATGSFSGWNISAQTSGAFSDGGASLPANALSLNSSATSGTTVGGPSDYCVTNSTCTVAGDPNVAYPITIPTSTSAGATVYDAGANTGMGSMGVGPLDWWLAVPGNALAGVYTTTLTLSINSGPVG